VILIIADMKSRFICILLIIGCSLAPQAKAECVGCGFELIAAPIGMAILNFGTSAIPALALDENKDYSYWSSWRWGIGLSVTGMLLGSTLVDDYPTRAEMSTLGALIGLIAGNYIGYRRSVANKTQGFYILPQKSGAKIQYSQQF
jgi:hypothetical protein